MTVTMLEAAVDRGRSSELVDSFKTAGDPLPPGIVESFLLKDSASNRWLVVTVWESREMLEGYRSSVDTPAGVSMFRSAGAEPTLALFEVEAHASRPQKLAGL